MFAFNDLLMYVGVAVALTSFFVSIAPVGKR